MSLVPKLERIWGGGDHTPRTPYMTRIVWGRLRLHVFHRGDEDPDPHDHMWDFWVFPLVGYLEERWDHGADTMYRGGYGWDVTPFRIHFRRAEHIHRVLCRSDDKSGPIVTIVWTGRKRRGWGFWVLGEHVPWRRYFGMKEEPAYERRRRPGLFDHLKRPRPRPR